MLPPCGRQDLEILLHPNYADLNHKCYTLCRPLDDVVEHSRQPLYFPFQADREYGHKKFTFVGVIHGVVCVSYSWVSSLWFSSPSFISTFLWNPTIHKYVALPCLRLPANGYAIGFGYDTSRKDFKVVLICEASGTYQVYSDRRGCWRTATADIGVELSTSWHFTGSDRPCFVNGTIHWALSLSEPNRQSCYAYNKHAVLMFDCESEEFRKIDLPEKIFWSPTLCPLRVELFEYAGMLAALADMGHFRQSLDVWVMEEHGVCSSWKKLYMIPEGNRITICDPTYEKLAPYGPNNQWNMYNGSSQCHNNYVRFNEILSVHV